MPETEMRTSLCFIGTAGEVCYLRFPCLPFAVHSPHSKGTATFQKLGVSVFLCFPYKRPTTAVKGRGMGRGVPLSSRLRGLWEHRELPRRGLGQSPSRKWFWGFSCVILYDFTHVLAHLTAALKWEIPTSLYWLVGLIFPFNFLGYRSCQTPPTWIFGVSGQCTHSGWATTTQCM